MHRLQLTGESFLIDGKKQPLLMGEIHYFRMPRESWEPALDKLKECGLNGVAYYVPWFVHEPEEGVFDFFGKLHPQNDLHAWIRLTMEKGLIGFLRPGPFVYAETANLGIPQWFLDKYPNAQVQSYSDGKYENASTIHCPGHNHPGFMGAVEKWYAAVAREIKDYLAPKGNVSLVQLCNEIPCDDHDDRNPENLGLGKENGLYPALLKKRYGDVDTLNGRYHTHFNSFFDIAPHLLEAADPELYLLDRLAFYYEEYYPLYFRRLRQMFLDHGVDAQFIHNAYNPRAISLHVSNREQNPWLNVGVDCYYSLNGRLGMQDATYYCEFSSEYLRRFLHNVPWVIEQECGYWHDYPKVYGLELYIFIIWTMAAGYQGMNMYLFASGRNRPGMGFFGTAHDWQAPVDMWGNAQENYLDIKRSIIDVLMNQDVFLSENRYDIALGIKSDPGLIWKKIGKPSNETYFALKTAGFSPRLVDFAREDLKDHPALFVVSDEVMAEDAQEKLSMYVQAGGNLILSGRVPSKNTRGEACSILAQQLGVQVDFCPISNQAQERLTLDGVEYYLGTTVQPLACNEGTVLAASQGGLPAALLIAYGKGKALLLPFTVENLFVSMAELMEKLLGKMAILPFICGARMLRVIPKASGHAVVLNLHPVAVSETVTVGGISHTLTLAPHSFQVLQEGIPS